MTRETSTLVYEIFFKILDHQKLKDKQAAAVLGIRTELISRYRRKSYPIPPTHLFTLLSKFNYNLFLVQFSKNKI